MADFVSTEGFVTDIEAMMPDNSSQAGCTLLMTLQTQNQGIVNLTVSAGAYALDSRTIYPGDFITAFYDASAPVPLIYPPRYTAVVIAKRTTGETMYALDYFNYNLVNSDNTLRLNPTSDTKITLPNGQIFLGGLSGKLLFVVYRNTTRSIPAITSPEQVIVFCS